MSLRGEKRLALWEKFLEERSDEEGQGGAGSMALYSYAKC